MQSILPCLVDLVDQVSQHYHTKRKGLMCCNPSIREIYVLGAIIFDEVSFWWSNNDIVFLRD